MQGSAQALAQVAARAVVQVDGLAAAMAHRGNQENLPGKETLQSGKPGAEDVSCRAFRYTGRILARCRLPLCFHRERLHTEKGKGPVGPKESCHVAWEYPRQCHHRFFGRR